ncbi:MAG: ATP-binding cassette domain-containing protein [Patescibacteria group bacterium]|jgi:ABC-2 type transport system ATP-binding protein
MINVNSLTKKFGNTTVLDHLSFQVKQGEILGFLGPNGAGKTTTMRILTGILAPSSGTVSINQHDILDQSLVIRKQIGYLPENNPLYETMRVYEYLEFVAKSKQLPDITATVKQVVHDCHLFEKITSPISELSKGYRQRVGLAAALLGNPNILFLDEPTSGLDPNQAAEIRKLIRNIGKTKTIVFSTHILAEVQAICDRAIIINQGKIVAQGTVNELISQTQGKVQIQAEIEGSVDAVTKALQQLPDVQTVSAPKIHQYIIELSGKQDVRKAIFELCVQHHWILLGLRQSDVSLEDVFRQLTTSPHA